MVTFPISLPAAPNFRDFVMAPERAISQHLSPFSLQAEIQAFSGRRWMLEFTLPTITSRVIAEQWISTMLLLDGFENTVLIGDPDATSFLGDLTGSTPIINGAGQQGRKLNVGGLAVSKSGIMLPGDYFQLGTGEQTRLYKVLESVTSDAGGLAQLSIWPQIREAPSNGEALVTTSPKGTFRFSNPSMSWTTNQLKNYAFRLTFMEAI